MTLFNECVEPYAQSKLRQGINPGEVQELQRDTSIVIELEKLLGGGVYQALGRTQR